MYGLILQNMAEYIRKSFGPGKWNQVRDKMEIKEVGYGEKKYCI